MRATLIHESSAQVFTGFVFSPALILSVIFPNVFELFLHSSLNDHLFVACVVSWVLGVQSSVYQSLGFLHASFCGVRAGSRWDNGAFAAQQHQFKWHILCFFFPVELNAAITRYNWGENVASFLLVLETVAQRCNQRIRSFGLRSQRPPAFYVTTVVVWENQTGESLWPAIFLLSLFCSAVMPADFASNTT